MISAIISRVIILLFGTLYPAYASYKAVRTKNVKEYVKWMMYWIVFAFFTCIETFTDIFLSWFPFYYEIKVLIVLWLLSPATKGSSTLYRKFVHPMLTRREPEIDEYINQAKEKGYTAVLQLGSKGVNYATNVIMQTALKGGGNLVQTIRRSYSLSDLSEPDDQRTQDEVDEVGRPQRILRQRNQTVRSSSGGRNVDMYFSEVDVGPKPPQPNFNYMRSSDDISSGYSSAEPVSTGLSRTASLTNATRPRFKAKRAEGGIYLESDEYAKMPEVRYPLRTHPYHIHVPNYPNQNPLNKTNKPGNWSINDIAVLKNEAFFDNEKYRQNDVLESLVKNKLPDNHENEKSEVNGVRDNGNENVNSCEVIQTSNATPNEKNISDKSDEIKENIKIESKIPIPNPFIPVPGSSINKYELFYKWLEDFEKMKATSHQKSEPSQDLQNKEGSSESFEEDDFLDPVSDSEEESYHDTESPGATNEKAGSIIAQSNHEQSLNDCENKTENEVLADKQSSIQNCVDGQSLLPTILDDFGSSSKCPISDGKRQLLHHKGKAPEPPTSILDLVRGEPISSEPDVESAQKEKQHSDAKNPVGLPEIVVNVNSSADQNVNSSQQHTRSPSPKSDTKAKAGKMSLFKSYLPTFLRPESPKLNNVSNDDKEKDNEYPKETQI